MQIGSFTVKENSKSLYLFFLTFMQNIDLLSVVCPFIQQVQLLLCCLADLNILCFCVFDIGLCTSALFLLVVNEKQMKCSFS